MQRSILSVLVALTLSLAVKAQTYTSTTMVTGLNYPVAFDVADDGRFFITQKGGNSSGSCANGFIRVFSSAGTSLGTFYNLTDSVQCDFERGLLGIELDPDFTNNHYVYVYYNHYYAGDERIRIVRFTEVANVGTNPTIIFDLDIPNNINGNHVGGNLHFRPSDPNHLYFTIGDLAYALSNQTLNYANKLTNPYGKIHRINLDGSAPTDNPFYDDGNPLVGNCDWIWSYGHRNSFDFCFNPVTDSMYCSENGQNTYDEVNIIHRGGFYGWAACEGNFDADTLSLPCHTTGDIRPISVWGPGGLPAVTGIVFYTGTVWAAIENHLIVADNDFGRIYDCTMGNAPAYDVVTTRVQMGDLTTSGGLTTLRQSVDGCVFAMKGGYTTNGQIYKVCPLGIGIAENNTALNSLVVYPNPASGVLNIESTFLSNTDLNAELIDFSGRLIHSCEANTVKGNKCTYSIDLLRNKIAKGIYFVQIKNTLTKEVMATTKVVVD
ncbi:MAG: PQQ-dependent sugar dehydrogenase [Bacteroidota bacterium]|nr:PQQ-dependent sugar dehydrogenase [Bacteroidota bacterium]